MLAPALITRLTLTDFRNYEALRLEPAARLIVLTGPNGAGKTNLIEAISLLSPGRGLRGADYAELARHGAEPHWAVAVETGGVALGTEWTASAEAASRRVAIDGRTQRSPAALGQHLRLLWLTPAMDRLFAGPASERRRFLDRLVQAQDPAHAGHLTSFETAMRERNRLLEQTRPDTVWIAALEAGMAEMAAAIAAARRSAIEVLQHQIARRLPDSVFPWAEIGIDGELEAALTRMPAVQAEDEYRHKLSDSRGEDRAAGRCLTGPHRSDFVVRHGLKAIDAASCSTGEQKALLIGLVLAQAGVVKDAEGSAPVLLLDEVAAHLDQHRRRGLFEALETLGAQSFMTGTEPELFAAIPSGALCYSVEAATVTRTA